MDTNGVFFRSLPANIQEKYQKMQRLYATLEDPNLKLCPREGCEGLMRIEEGSPRMQCQ
jgi:hypothetical protein